MDAFTSPVFLAALGQIIIINILLSGDNAVVIALACRNLPEKQRKMGIFWGVAGAVILRVVLTIFAVKLLTLPWLKVVGALALLWIGIQLIQPEDDGGGHEVAAHDRLMDAVKTILIADLVMSLDNVLGVAAAAKGDFLLLSLGLGISVPLVIWGSQIVLWLIERFPLLILAGGALLGYVAGEMFETDPAIDAWLHGYVPHHVLPWIGLMLVVVIGKTLAARKRSEAPTPA